MKIGGSLFGLNFSARGMSLQRKKMDLISQNIANADNVRTENGEPYQRKYLKVETDKNSFAANLSAQGQVLQLNVSDENHMERMSVQDEVNISTNTGSISTAEETDQKAGDVVYMPDSPDADKNGYVQMSNVNVINEMVDMIAATRSYEANLQSLNSAKQMAKDSLEI